MARSCTRCNAGGAFTDDCGTPVPISAISRTFTSAFASILGLPGRYIDKDLQRATKLVLKLFVKGQELGQLQASFAPCKQPLKAQFPDLY